MTRIVGERGVVLHTRPYRESSLIVNVLTEGHGRVAAVAKGVRARGRRKGNELQAFNQVVMSWSGRGSMVTLTGCEGLTHPLLTGDDLAAAFYLVELVTRLLAEHENAPRVFAATVWALESLVAAKPAGEVVLRRFEKLLLEELGYGVDFCTNAESGEGLDARLDYSLVLEHGFVPAVQDKCDDQETFVGVDLLAIANEDYGSSATRRAAKMIFRRLLAAQLGPKPLASRRLLFRGKG